MEPHPRRPPEPAVTLDDLRMALQLTARGGTLRAIRTTVRTGQNQRLSGGRGGGGSREQLGSAVLHSQGYSRGIQVPMRTSEGPF